MEPKVSVVGLSSLRAAEDKNKVVVKSEKALQLEAYLQKYAGDGSKPEKKKKKKKREARMGTGVKLHDEDVRWQDAREPSSPDAAEREEEDDIVPVVVNLEEAKHEARMMQRAKKFGEAWQQVPEAGAPGPSQSAAAGRHDSDDDDASPRRRPAAPRHDSDDEGDASPPRRGARHDSDNDASPTRRAPGGRHDSDDDASPPRRATATRHDSDGDASPPRKPAAGRHDSDEDASPPRRAAAGRHDSGDNASPPRRGKAGRRDSDGDASPPRRAKAPRCDSDGDASPPRRGKGGAATVPDRSMPPPPPRSAAGAAGEGDKKKAFGQKMADGTSAGVVSGRLLSEEMAVKRAADKQRIMDMSAEQSGRGAAAVHRVDGRIVSKEEYQAANSKKADAKKRQPKFLEEEVEWKRGLAQQRAAEAEAEALKRESGKKFHRGFDDDADAEMRRELRADDPMAAYVAAQQLERGGGDAALTDRHAAELVSSSGFVIPQETPAHSWLRRRVQATANRFKLKPGRHWDGVHRSNGFESFLFSHSNRKQADATELYVWSQDV